MKKKAFSFIELIVVIAIIGVLCAIFIPIFTAQNPATKLIGNLISSGIIILIVAFFLFYSNIINDTKQKNIPVIIVTIALLGLETWYGFKNLTPHTVMGEIKNVHWEYKISIETEQEVKRDDEYVLDWVETRTIDTQGFDKNPYWGEVKLQPEERRGPSTERYSVLVEEKNNITEYFCDKDTWEIFYKGKKIAFEYRKLDNYIVELYE